MIKTLAIKKETVFPLTLFALFVLAGSLAPLAGNQYVTGPLVNATLFLSAALLGPQAAVMVGLFPSLIALSVGLLPAVLAPMVPFIMTANALLIASFSLLRKRNSWLAAISASFLKFLFLSASSFAVLELISKKEIAQKAALMMSWPQLLTALLGAAIACFILKISGKKD